MDFLNWIFFGGQTCLPPVKEWKKIHQWDFRETHRHLNSGRFLWKADLFVERFNGSGGFFVKFTDWNVLSFRWRSDGSQIIKNLFCLSHFKHMVRGKKKIFFLYMKNFHFYFHCGSFNYKLIDTYFKWKHSIWILKVEIFFQSNQISMTCFSDWVILQLIFIYGNTTQNLNCNWLSTFFLIKIYLLFDFLLFFTKLFLYIFLHFLALLVDMQDSGHKKNKFWKRKEFSFQMASFPPSQTVHFSIFVVCFQICYLIFSFQKTSGNNTKYSQIFYFVNMEEIHKIEV